MARLHCCSFGRSFSPEPEPVRLVDTSQRGRFALSSHASSAEGSDVRPIREIFASASKDEDSQEMSTASAHDIPSRRQTPTGIHRKGSSRLLHEVAGGVRKRLSLDSGIIKRSSKHRLRSSRDTEDLERRDELKRALHRRVQDDLIEDPTASDNIYDEDAIPIKTPKTSWGREEGSIQISPKQLSKALRKSESRTSYAELSQRDFSQSYAPKSTAIALSRMLTQRASHATGESEDQIANTLSESPKGKRTSKKYVFEGEDSPKEVLKTRTPSPLTRANTVIRVQPSNKPPERIFANPTFLDRVAAPLSPDLLPTRLDSITDSAADGEWRLSFSERCKALPVEKHESFAASTNKAKLPVIYDTKIRPASEQWLHGASGLLSPIIHLKRTSHESSQGDNKEPHHCDPTSEEMDFGGIDGEDDSPPESTYQNARTRANSEGDEPGHLYNTHVPRRLASKSLLPSECLPELREPRRDRSYVSGDSTALFSAEPRHRVSSEEIITSKIPLAWDNRRPRAASSVYSSQPESLISSRRNSLFRITSLPDRVQHLKDYPAGEDIVSVPAVRLKSVDVDKLERRRSSTMYHSSTESLRDRELAAAERRISTVHRTNTLPKDSRFKEDLDQISAELALTNPPRRRFSNLDGGGDWRSPSISPSRSLSRISINDKATSVWEKALREHAREDAALLHTRLGSYSPDLLGPTDIDPQAEAPSKQLSTRPSLYRGQDHLSVGEDPGLHLQARLAAYKLPTYHHTPKKRPSIDEAKRSSSARPIGSWARYPSHSRAERSSSPAGVEDQVFARDFADMTPKSIKGTSPTPQGSKLDTSKRKKSMSFGKNMLSSLSRLYKSQSQDLQRRLTNEARGHRSSISEGGMLEYPELELLSRVSTPLPTPDVASAVIEEDRMATEERMPVGVRMPEEERMPVKASQAIAAGNDANKWSKLYEDCVVPPTPSEFGASPIASPNRISEEIGPQDVDVRSVVRRDRKGGSTSSELRASTVDFKKSLELHEAMARERALELMERMSA